MMPQRIVLNLQQSRAEKSITQVVIVDFKGKKHVVGTPSVDAILALMEIEAEFGRTKLAEDNGTVSTAQQIEMIVRLKELILTLLPDFPVGGLQLEELMEIGQALQESIVPDGVQNEDDEPGE
jgi:hypothetical protein